MEVKRVSNLYFLIIYKESGFSILLLIKYIKIN